MRCILILLCLIASSTAYGQYPDGTLVLSSKKGLIGRVAKRITGGDQYTHVGVVINGRVYESDWPRSKSTPVNRYGKRRTTNDYYVPKRPFSSNQVQGMLNHAKANLNQPYRLRNYFHPNSRKVNGTWCSPYVGGTLNASGRYNLSNRQIHEPQNIINSVRSDYSFSRRISK